MWYNAYLFVTIPEYKALHPALFVATVDVRYAPGTINDYAFSAHGGFVSMLTLLVV